MKVSDEVLEQIAKMRPVAKPQIARYASVSPEMPTQIDFIEAIPHLPQILTGVQNSNHWGIDLLGEAWEYSSTYLMELFGKENVLLMMEVFGRLAIDPSQQEYLESLPEQVPVFRGGDGVADAENALSWTLSQQFAEMHAGDVREEIIVRGTVHVEDVLFFSATEMEVVVRPGAVTGIEVVEFDSTIS